MIQHLTIQGYKSIKEMELEMRPINILIGGNGSGKSNFISFFKLIHAIFNQRLQRFVMEEQADNLLYFGRKTTAELCGKLIFSDNSTDNNAYVVNLAANNQNGMFINSEGSGYNVSKEDDDNNYYYESNINESSIKSNNSYRNTYLKKYISNLQIFHFHDTSTTSWLRKACDINDNLYLKPDGRNLPAFLYFLQEKHSKVFHRIFKTIQSIAPYIDRFILQPNLLNNNQIELRWVEKDDLESNFSAYHFSDGTLRFIALATVLMQPEPPKVIIIDEPELGLHPFALTKLAGMIQSVSQKAQIIVATQSPSLISNFEAEDVIVVDKSKEERQSIFKRLDSENLTTWLEEYNLGELWERDIINAAQPFMK